MLSLNFNILIVLSIGLVLLARKEFKKSVFSERDLDLIFINLISSLLSTCFSISLEVAVDITSKIGNETPPLYLLSDN